MNLEGGKVPVPFAPEDITKVAYTSGYGMRDHPEFGDRRMHRGIDLGAPLGTKLLSLVNGTIVRTGTLGGYGNVVEVKGDDGKFYLYSHLQDRLVQNGQQVGQGQPIATVGSTGVSTGPHLDLSIWSAPNSTTASIEPVSVLNNLQRAAPVRQQRGMGLPPRQAVKSQNSGGGMYRRNALQQARLAQPNMPAGATPLATGGYVVGTQVYLPAEQMKIAQDYTRRQPNFNYRQGAQFEQETSLVDKLAPMTYENTMFFFDGGSGNVMRRVIGMAEGNRTADGGYTDHANGHTDPGNGAYNIGSYSAQGNLNDGTIEGSDRRVEEELLKPRVQRLFEAADKAGVQVTAQVLFAYLDLANQAPLAADGDASGRGFLGLLPELRGRETDIESILELRVEAFKNDNTGNYETTFASREDLKRDQRRRLDAIIDAIRANGIGGY